MKVANFVPPTLEILEQSPDREVAFRTTYQGLMSGDDNKWENVGIGKLTSYEIVESFGSKPEIVSMTVRWKNGTEFNYGPGDLLVNIGDPWLESPLIVKNHGKREGENLNPNTAFRRDKRNDKRVQGGIRIPKQLPRFE